MSLPRTDSDPRHETLLGREQIRDLLAELGARLAREGVLAEVALYGGSALSLLYDFRPATQDVDYYPITECDGALQREAVKMAGEHDLPSDWFNDAVADVIGGSVHEYYGDFPSDAPGLRVFVAKPQYLLAMKCFALRSSLVSSDPYDVWHLLDSCKISTMPELTELLEGFFPGRALSRRNGLILEDILESKAYNAPYDPVIGI